MDDKKCSQSESQSLSVAEPVAVRPQDLLDGMLAYITDQNISAALRYELGHRLILGAEHDMQVRPVFELQRQIRELQRKTGLKARPHGDTFDNAFVFVDACRDESLISKASIYLTDHSTLMLKLILNDITSSVDIGKSEFTYSIVNTATTYTKMGRGTTDDVKSVKEYYNQLKKLKK